MLIRFGRKKASLNSRWNGMNVELSKRRNIFMAEKLSEIAAEKAARLFHELYEAYAPNFDYETREESAVPWSRVPENAYSEAFSFIVAATTESREPQWISVDQ